MAEVQERCAATTKAGKPCKNPAGEGSSYCHIHQSWAETALEAPPPIPEDAIPANEPEEAGKGKLSEVQREEFRQIAEELNQIAEELDQSSADFTPPLLTPDGLVRLVQENIYRFTPQAQRELIETLKGAVQGTSREDLVNPDTWKGFWYVLNYMAQNQKNEVGETLSRRLEQVPGFALLSDVRGGLKDAKPSDFLEPDTWKGLYYIANYSARMQINQMKERILGRSSKE